MVLPTLLENLNLTHCLFQVQLPMPPPDIEAYMLSMCDTDDDVTYEMMLNEKWFRTSARLRDLHSYTLKANYMKCEDCLKRHVARQVSILITFCKQLLNTKLLCATYQCLQFVFELFLLK